MGKYLHVEREILIYAFRYALGRMSFAPYNVIEAVKDNIDSVNDYDIRLMIQEIRECENFGMEMDKDKWISFLLYLEDELKKRNKEKEETVIRTGSRGEQVYVTKYRK